MIGRQAEVEVLEEVLAAGRRMPVALVLDGEAGVGKTTLFESAVASAREQEYTVYSCRPAASETAFSFAALADLLRPALPGGLDRLPLPQRRALSAALLLEDVAGAPPDERAIAFALFQLLGEDAGGPLLVAVDDVQWLDAPSASVLAFALRRRAAAAAATAMLVARRSSTWEAAPLGLERALPSERLHRLRIGPLSIGAIHRLLRERLGVSFSRPVLVRLYDTSGGNPFYALELGRALEQSGGHYGAGDRLSIPTSLTELLSARLAGLPGDVRATLEPVALLSRPTVQVVAAAVDSSRTVRRRLRKAEDAAILVRDDEQIRFSHPLLAAQVDAELDPRRRRSLHRRLAGLVTDAEQHARHLALAADGPSTTVAEALEAAALAAASRGASGTAAELAELAASLTPSTEGDDVRRRRGLLAADHHHASGDVGRARALLEPLLEQLPPGPDRAEVLRRIGEWSADDMERSERLLEQAFVEAAADPRLRAEIAVPRILTTFLRHGPAAAVTLAHDSAQVVEESGDRVLLAAFLAELSFAELCANGVTPGLLERALELEAQLGPLAPEPRATLVEGLRRMYADEHDSARAALQRVHASAVNRGDDPARTEALLFLGELECRAGNWKRADKYADAMLQSAEQQGLDFQGGSALWINGLVDAYLGRLEQARARATEGVSRSEEENEQAFLERNLALLGFIDLSTGDYSAAAERLAPVVRRRQARGAGEPSLYPAREIAIEALVASGDIDEARTQLDWLEEAGDRLGTPWPLAMGARCRGLLVAAEGDLEAAIANCRRALEVHERMPSPFERARTLLVYGTILRRAKRKKAAREAMEEALSIFQALPAPVWAENARAELARIGGRAPGGDELTEGERRIAEQIAAGKSNKEAAAALFLSVHTVESALTRVYRKLGVRSRTELTRRLGDLPQSKDP